MSDKISHWSIPTRSNFHQSRSRSQLEPIIKFLSSRSKFFFHRQPIIRHFLSISDQNYDELADQWPVTLPPTLVKDKFAIQGKEVNWAAEAILITTINYRGLDRKFTNKMMFLFSLTNTQDAPTQLSTFSSTCVVCSPR